MWCARVPLVTAITAAVLWLGTALAEASPRVHDPHQALPVVNVNYIGRQLVFMSTHYLMRYSGFDGPPGDLRPADGNKPPNINGWQEFFLHWKQQLTSKAVMGRTFASAVNVSDHLFPVNVFGAGNAPYPGDVRVATIPGQSCPGQVALVAGHPDSTPALNTGNGSSYDDTSGVTMGMGELQALAHWWEANHAWPERTIKVALFDAEEVGLEGSQYYASHLISPGPQGRYVVVANMDQNGLEYPAYPEGTTSSTWTPGPWYTNINASPVKDFSIYGPNAHTPPPAIANNMRAIRHFRAALSASVRRAFSILGAQYHFRIPLDNPNEDGKTAPGYRPSDIARYSPVQDDTLGRTDQVPFVALGIPGYGVLGAYDSGSKEDIVGNTPLSPLGNAGLFSQQAGYDTPEDNMEHFNLLADGNPVASHITTGLFRALQLPATWTMYLLARREYVGAVKQTARPIAYYEALPTVVAPRQRVSFDASGSVSRGGGSLRYYWDFGDRSHAIGRRISHSYTRAGWYDAVLTVVNSRGQVSGYRTGIRVGEATRRPATNSCGTVGASREAHVILENGGSVPAGLPTADRWRSGR
ncbi:MAG TPA: M28 family peptidase [Solirubrobacteraceae bacterium]